jgi:5-methylcytosine-specific restriction endonuclease McrA
MTVLELEAVERGELDERWEASAWSPRRATRRYLCWWSKPKRSRRLGDLQIGAIGTRPNDDAARARSAA